jgi:hypothetical protein
MHTLTKLKETNEWLGKAALGDTHHSLTHVDLRAEVLHVIPLEPRKAPPQSPNGMRGCDSRGGGATPVR